MTEAPAAIMDAMEDLMDEMTVLALCCALLLWQPAEPFAVAAALGAIILCCLRPAGAPLVARAAAQLAFLAATAAWPFWSLFLPVGVYVGLRERPWPLRLAWAAALAASIGRGLLTPAMACSLTVLCAVAAALAVRASRSQAERAALRRRGDSLRERMLQLAEGPAMPSSDASAATSPAGHPDDPEPFDDLTERELAIVRQVARGLDNKDIAAELYLSEGTVRNHISAVLQKKGLKNRTQLAVLYLGAPLG